MQSNDPMLGSLKGMLSDPEYVGGPLLTLSDYVQLVVHVATSTIVSGDCTLLDSWETIASISGIDEWPRTDDDMLSKAIMIVSNAWE